MKVIKAYAKKNPCYKAKTPMTPKGIVVHSTGANNPNLWRYVDCPSKLGKNVNNNTLNSPNAEVCVHAFIGKDKNGVVQVAKILPYKYASWGVGQGIKGSYNYNPVGHIQFEMCEDDLKDKKYCTEVYNKAVEYCAMLCKTYKFDPLAKGVIISHHEANQLGYGSDHIDPDNWWKKHGFTMDKFRKAVYKKLNPEVTYKVGDKVTVNGAVYKTANTSTKAETLKGTKMYIVEITKGNKHNYGISKKKKGSLYGWVVKKSLSK